MLFFLVCIGVNSRYLSQSGTIFANFFYQAFCGKLGLVMISAQTYYRYLSTLVYNCVYEFWLLKQADDLNNILVIDETQFIHNYVIMTIQKNQEDTGRGPRLAGDGRFDSPGWSAKFCNYFIQVSSNIIFIEI